MDAQPILARIAKALARARLEAVLIGNAGAALHGAPVTTLDFDFFFRDTPANRRNSSSAHGSWGPLFFARTTPQAPSFA